MANNSALDSVIDQATTAADSAAPNTGGALVAQAQQGTAVATSRPSLDDMADNSGMTVDAYLSVKEAGLRIDKEAYFQEAEVTIDLTAVVPIFSVRANRGGSTTFIKSYDGRMTSQGENFQQATQRLQASHDKVDGPYQTAEIPVVLLKDVPGAKKGQTLGITPAITGVKFWTKFYKELREKGLSTSTVKAKITCVPQTNKNGNEWGVVGFELIDRA
jgi:hypothetical protein